MEEWILAYGLHSSASTFTQSNTLMVFMLPIKMKSPFQFLTCIGVGNKSQIGSFSFRHFYT